MMQVEAGASGWGEIELDLPRGWRGARSPRPKAEASRAPRDGREAAWGAGAGGRNQRLRAASGAAQAVVKVVGYRKGRGETGRTLNYVGKRERIDMEASDGTRLTTEEDLRTLLDDWSSTFSRRADGRDVMHLVLSFPADVAPEKAREIARAALPEMAQGRDFVFAVHDDTGHAHVHALVRMRGPDRRQLRTTRETMRTWREATARAARERGVAMEASPRWARGRGERPERGWERGMRGRGEISRRQREAAHDALSGVETRFETLIGATNSRERAALSALSWELIAAARSAKGEERALLFRLADAAARHGEAMPEARTRRQALAAIAEARRERGLPVDPESVAMEFVAARDASDRSTREREADVSSFRARAPSRSVPDRFVRGHDDAEERHQAWLEARAARRARDRELGRDPD